MTRCVIFEDNQFMSKQTLYLQNPPVYMIQLVLLHLFTC